VDVVALVRDPRLKIHHEDARVFLNRDTSTYDAVFLDAVWGRTIPFHLATVECFRSIATRPALDAPELRKYASHLWPSSVPQDIPALTGDFAPVEQYAARSREP
jgi:hypothetical protein